MCVPVCALLLKIQTCKFMKMLGPSIEKNRYFHRRKLIFSISNVKIPVKKTSTVKKDHSVEKKLSLLIGKETNAT